MLAAVLLSTTVGCGGAPAATRGPVAAPQLESTAPPAPGRMVRGEVREVGLASAEGGWLAFWLKQAQVIASLAATGSAEDVPLRLDARSLAVRLRKSCYAPRARSARSRP